MARKHGGYFASINKFGGVAVWGPLCLFALFCSGGGGHNFPSYLVCKKILRVYNVHSVIFNLPNSRLFPPP